MAIRGTFVLDFTQFDQALSTATQHLKTFESTGKGVQTRLQQVFNSFDGRKIIADAKLTATAVEKIGGASALTAAEMRRVNSVMNEAIAKYRALGVATKDIPANIRAMADATAQANRQASGLGTALSGATMLLARYVGPAALGAAVIQSARWAAELDDLAAKTNINVETLQRMTYAAERSGVGLEIATTAVAKMSQLMGDRDKGFVQAVARLGLNFDQLRQQDPGKTFTDLAVAVQAVEDPYARAALKQDLFGRGAKELDGYLKELAQTMKRDLPVASAETIKKIGEFDDLMAQLKVTTKVTVATIIGEFMRLAEFARKHPWLFAAQNISPLGQLEARFEARAAQMAAERPTPAGSAPLAMAQGFETPAQAALRTWATEQFLTENTTAVRENTAALRAHQAALMRTPMTPVSFADLGGPFAPSATLGVTPTLLGQTTGKTIANELVQASSRLLPSRDLGGGLVTAPNVSGRPLSGGPGFWSSAFGGQAGLTAGLTSTLMGSLMGGGSVSKSLGGFFGSSLGGWAGSLFASTGKVLGGAMGSLFGALGSAIPVVGAFVGPILGGLLGKLFGGGEAAKTQDARSQWLQQAGGIDEVRKMADYAGISIERLLSTKKTKVFEAEVKKLEAAFAATQKRVQALVGDLGKLSTSGGLMTPDLFSRLKQDAGKEEVQQALGQFLEQQTQVGVEALTKLAQGPALAGKALSALGGAAAALFEQLRQNGATSLQALQQIQPAVDALAKKFDALGVGGGEAWDQIRGMAALAADEFAGPLLESVDQVGRLMAALANTGWLNEEMFQGLASQVGSTYDQLIAAGKDGNQALLLMQPTLQKLWELQQQYGWSVDESTQKLIDQAVEQGTVGEKFKSSTDKMIDAVNKLIERLDVFLTNVLHLPQAAQTAADGMNDAFDDVQPPKYGEIQPDPYARGGWVRARNYLASGGWPFAPSGTDTVPAMLTPGEFVVPAGSARRLGTDVLQAVQAGRVPTGGGSTINLHVNIQALDRKSMRQATEEELVPLILDVVRQSGQVRTRLRDLVVTGA